MIYGPTVRSPDTRDSVDFHVSRGISSCLSVLYRDIQKWNSLKSDIKITKHPHIYRKTIKELIFVEYEFLKLQDNPEDVLRVVHLNAQQLNSSLDDMQLICRNSHPGIIGLCETYLNEKN